MARYLLLLMIAFVTVFDGYRNLASGHPHNWIILDSKFVVDSQNRLVAIEQQWEFDAFFSELTLVDLRREFGNEKIGLQMTAARFIENLKEYQYFSKLKVDKKSIHLAKPKPNSLIRVTKNGPSVLVMKMRFNFNDPIDLKNHTLTWQVYDPTYYIAMAYDTVKDITVVGPNASQCNKQLIEPNPSPELVRYAQSLDRTQQSFDGLGGHFNQKIHIRC